MSLDHLTPWDRAAEERAFDCRLAQLRKAWTQDRKVDVTYRKGDGSKVSHARGAVHRVASSDAFVDIAGLHIPSDLIVHVRIIETPHRAAHPQDAPLSAEGGSPHGDSQ